MTLTISDLYCSEVSEMAQAAFHTEVGAELSRLVAPLAPPDREHFRAALAEIIAGCRDHC